MPVRILNKLLKRAGEKTPRARAIWPESVFRLMLERERERADRGHHEFCLLVINVENGLSDKAPLIVQKIVRRIRNIDDLGWFNKNKIGIILPYTDPAGAADLIKQLNDSLNGILDQDLCEIYIYPLKPTNEESIAK